MTAEKDAESADAVLAAPVTKDQFAQLLAILKRIASAMEVQNKTLSVIAGGVTQAATVAPPIQPGGSRG